MNKNAIMFELQAFNQTQGTGPKITLAREPPSYLRAEAGRTKLRQLANLRMDDLRGFVLWARKVSGASQWVNIRRVKFLRTW